MVMNKWSEAIAAISDRLYDLIPGLDPDTGFLQAVCHLSAHHRLQPAHIKSPDHLINVRWVDFAHALI
jgi:hypothetical protein